MKTNLDLLQEFIARCKTGNAWGQNNTWLRDDNHQLEVYVRFSQVLWGDRACDCLDIANFDTKNPKRREELFIPFVAAAHTVNPWPVTHIEGIERELVKPLESIGFVLHQWPGHAPITDSLGLLNMVRLTGHQFRATPRQQPAVVVV